MNPGAPAVGNSAIETMSDIGLSRPDAARQDIPGGILKPGPGGGLPALRRQSLRLAAKSDAVKTQLRDASDAQSFNGEEGAQGVGRRLMDILTDERNLEGSRGGRIVAAGVRSADARGWSTAGDARQRPLAAALRPGSGQNAASGAGWVYAVPGIQGGYWLAYRPTSGRGSAAASSEAGAGGVARIALQVSRQSLFLSVVEEPELGLALRWAEDSARALVAQGPSGSDSALLNSELRDALAEPGVAAPRVLVPLGPQVQAAQSEVFSFLQSSDGQASDHRRDSAAASASSRSGPAPQRPGDAPVSVPDPLVGCALLPFAALLILRSRLFS